MWHKGAAVHTTAGFVVVNTEELFVAMAATAQAALVTMMTLCPFLICNLNFLNFKN